MKALRFHAAKDLRIEDIPQPTEPADDEVVIKNRFVGICGTDLHEYAYGPIFVPKDASGAATLQVLGHEYGGVVTKVGKKVTHVKVGDRVSVQPFMTPRGGDYFTDLGHFNLSDNLQIAGLSWIGGGMAQESLLKGYCVYQVPDNLTDEDAALVEPTAVAVYGVERAGVKAGDSCWSPALAPSVF